MQLNVKNLSYATYLIPKVQGDQKVMQPILKYLLMFTIH
jgi:hypothetical protein